MIDKKLEQEFNKQINAEFYSAYLYLSMSAYLSSINLNGFAHWMYVQYQEEQDHALKMYQYLIDRGARVILEEVEKPPTSWDSVVEVVEEVLKHEQKVTSLINNLMKLAYEKNDFASISFLQWFVDEQVEEEANVDKILQELKLSGGKGTSLLMLDREAGKRVFTPIEKNQ